MLCCKKSDEPLEQVVNLEQQTGSLLAESGSPDEDDPQIKRKVFEEDLLKTINEGNFEEIEKKITPKALTDCESSSLLMGMKVSFQLRKLADKKGADEERFNQLADTVESFTFCLLDPLRSKKDWREEFGDFVLDHIIDDATELDQKKFFTHPAVQVEMDRKFHGRDFDDSEKSKWKWWQLSLFHVLCSIDWVIFPLVIAVSTLKKRIKRKRKRRNKQGEEANEEEEEEEEEASYIKGERLYLSPYFKFIRDTLSYIVLVVLHYALCLSPSTIAVSGLEWAILTFFVGRYLVERQQIWDIMQHIKRRKKKGDVGAQSKWIRLKTLSVYLSDHWNLLDFISLLVYLIIVTLRLATLIKSGSEMNNRALAIAGYLYSFNSLCLTLRAFGHVTEQSRHLGVIQIALFGILKDISTVILQFAAGILAFSIAITKVYMSEKSFVSNGSDGSDITCKNSGISCWGEIITHLSWSLLGVSESDPMASVDAPSENIARILYAAFLIFGVVLLLNMLIALLCNTYQRIEDNSFKIWSIKRAITIQTYVAYDPVPVPLNIIYSIFKLLRLVKRKRKEKLETLVSQYMKELERYYFEEYENFFPLTDGDKMDRVLHETEKNRQMASQVLCTTFTSDGADQGVLCLGPKAWKVDPGIRVEGLLLTCVGSRTLGCQEDFLCRHSATHRKHFSAEFPHFEVVVLEIGKQRRLRIGMVNAKYDAHAIPLWKSGSAAYFIDDGQIIHNTRPRKTEGPAIAHRGDRIRCTVMLDRKQEANGKVRVPVLLTLNGREIIGGDDHIVMESDEPLYPYIRLSHGCSVVAKMCSREDLSIKPLSKSLEKTNKKIEELDKEVKEIRETMEKTNQKLDVLLARLTDVTEGRPTKQEDQG